MTGGGFTTVITAGNTTGIPCEVFFFATKGAGGTNQTGFNINGAPAPPVVQEQIPSWGTVTWELTAGSVQFVGAAVVDSVTPACSNRVNIQTKYLIEILGKLTEVFSYATPLTVPLNTCVELPVAFAPQPVNGRTTIPGIAKISVNPLEDSEYCVRLQDDQGNPLTERQCEPFDGSHDASLLPKYFPNQGPFKGSVEVCFNGKPSTDVRDQVSVLGIEVIQDIQDNIVQLGTINTTVSNKDRCVQDEDTLCVHHDRFKIEVKSAMVGDINDDESGFFYFFNPNQNELLVKLLDACSSNGHFWVFGAATTNAEFDLTVTDTFSGESREYNNPGVFQPILDTSAFATCP